MDFIVKTAYASPGSTAASFDNLLTSIVTNIVDPIIYLIMAIAVIYFLWGVVAFIKDADKPEKRSDGQRHMIFGILGLAIMLSARGIIHIILVTMGLV